MIIKVLLIASPGKMKKIGSNIFVCLFSYIDQVSLIMRSKSASEVLNDATLTTLHSLESASYFDTGPNGLSGTAANATAVPGRVNQALSFTSNSSYYQVCN